MKYIKYLVAFLLGFIFISNVQAENIIQLDNYDTSTSANFYNCTGSKNCNNAVGSNSILASSHQIWQSKSKINLVANSYGGALSFYSKEAFIKDNYYSVSVVIGNGSNTNFTTVTTSENYAVGTGNSVNNAFSNVIMTVNRSANNGYAVYKMLGSENKNIGSAMGLTKNSLLCYTFKAPANGNTVVVTFTTTSTITNYLMFYGYKVTSHGAKSPSTDDIKKALSSSFSNINSNIDKVNTNINNVNSNIDKLKEQENANHTEAEKTRKGILGKVGDIVSGITNLPKNIWNNLKSGFDAITKGLTDLPGFIWNAIKGGFSAITTGLTNLGNLIGGFFDNLLTGIIDGLKSLFVPTDDQLLEIINDSKELSENFGFVGESVNFFLNIFTALLGLVNSNGCIELPKFEIGATSLFDAHTFWDAQQVCLSDNIILANNITTIRAITSIALVALFVNFAASKFFNIISKNDNENLNSNEVKA